MKTRLLPILEGLAGLMFLYESLISLMSGKYLTCLFGLLVAAVLLYLSLHQLSGRSKRRTGR